MPRSRKAFTLMEIMVVLAIVGILAALLFPAFGRARENGRQASCASNLAQIGRAVAQYYQDERRYPAELLFLLPSDFLYNNTGATVKNLNAPGYFKGGSQGLLCPSDDFEDSLPRSSYGNISAGLTVANGNTRDGCNGTTLTSDDPGRYLWNYWGYQTDGTNYQSPDEAAGLSSMVSAGAPSNALVKPTAPYNHRYMTGFSGGEENVMKYSLSNRFAPPQTIITHCVVHRTWTAAGLDYPGEIYAAPDRGQGGRDIVLRLDGSARVLDVSLWNTGTSQWQVPAQ